MKHTDHARLDRLRRGATLTRYHAHRVLRPQSVGEHSHGVAMLAVAIFRDAYGETLTPETLILAALEHDLAEFDVGDTPAPAKRRSPALKAALDAAEAEVDERLGLWAARSLLEPTARLMGACDELEFLFYSYDEIRLGNSDFLRTFCLGSLGFAERLGKLATENTWAWIEVARNVHRELERAVTVAVGTDKHLAVQLAAVKEREMGR